MIKLIEASNFRSIKYISQPLDAFHVLIGANATGKTTFLDVIKLMADIVSIGIDKAIFARVPYFDELTFGGKGGDIELAIEAELPDNIKQDFVENPYDTIRYEIRIGILPETHEMAIKDERVTLFISNNQFCKIYGTRTLFPEFSVVNPIFNKKLKSPYKSIATKKFGGNDVFAVEPTKDQGKGSGWIPTFKLGIKKSALGNLPEDETKFPASTWLKSFLQNGVQLFILDSLTMRIPSAPGQSIEFKTDGSNLPWVIDNLKKDQKKFTQWIDHIQTALPDIEDIITVVREEDRKRYIKVKYKSGIEVPSWLVSDGTLRLLALTIPAYLRELNGVFLIEEPENGIHPKAIETIFLSLSSVYNAQILLASHSTIILGLVNPQQLLCFAKTQEGVTDIVLGKNHPKLKDWRGNPNLNVLFASGILS
jgi:predicted ATPase